MSKSYFREQKHICGKDYESANYMEVDIYPVTLLQHRSNSRAKKSEASTLAQQVYNDKRAKRYHVQLVNTNFCEKDFSFTGTYDDEHLPVPMDREQVDRDWNNFIKRIYRWCDKNEVRRPKWIAAAEYATFTEDLSVIGRHHHHAIIEHTEGLTRDILESLWRDRSGNSLGFCRCDNLQLEHGSVKSLVEYISKNKRCDRSWRQSRGLEKPKTPRPNDSKWNAKKLREASTTHIEDREFWERQYPGFIFDRCETHVSDAGQRHTLVIMYRDPKIKNYSKPKRSPGQQEWRYYG